ncbi:hypothetical protein [Geoglobus ahangari]
MINFFKVKKYAGFFMMAFFPTLAFFVALLRLGDFIYATLAFLGVTFLMMLIASRLISHPLLQLLEGKGFLAIKLDSTGVINPFICQVVPPYVKGRLGKNKEVEDVWDRKAVYYLKPPEKGKMAIAEDQEGNKYEVIILGKAGEDKHDKLFGFEGFPTFIYNEPLGTFITKQALAKFEDEALVKHKIFYVSKKIDELLMVIRDFARYVVEQTRPKKAFFGLGNWFWLIVLAILALLAILLLPMVMDMFSGATRAIAPVQPVNPAPVSPR